MGNSDASHYGNVVSFDELTGDAKGFDSHFNPSNDNRLINFDRLTTQLELIPEYVPNESDLNIVGLRTLWNSMDNANKAVLNAENGLSNARSARNTELCAPVTGLTRIGQGCKLYIKAAFGTKSPQYLQVAKIRFRTYYN